MIYCYARVCKKYSRLQSTFIAQCSKCLIFSNISLEHLEKPLRVSPLYEIVINTLETILHSDIFTNTIVHLIREALVCRIPIPKGHGQSGNKKLCFARSRQQEKHFTGS